MIAQLAQFSALEQMNNLNTRVADFQSATAMTQLLLSGQPMEAVVDTDTESEAVRGVVENVDWSNGALFVVVGGARYALEDVVRLTPVIEPNLGE